jgi:tetraacyldisaccharide-1-P 4'-kinase
MANCLTVPRLVVARTASGIGKTSVMVGLTRALRQRGLRVAGFLRERGYRSHRGSNGALR